MYTTTVILLTLLSWVPRLALAHVAFWHPSMWGFNVTDKTYPYDNRPVTPLADMTFSQWWFHGHLDHPPNAGDFFELPAGQAATSELACNKGATSFFASSEGGDIRDGNNVCPGSDMSEYHTTGIDDLFGCALAITYKSDVSQVQPEDFTVFSVNQTCVWTRFTDFKVPVRMPTCPDDGCICAWFWIHSPNSGGEQNYMNGFRCKITNSTSHVPLAPPQVPRRCGADPANGKMEAAPGNCTYGAKQPFYWFQAERNNMFEGTYSPPRYLDMYNFLDGAQDDIFQDSYPGGLPPPSPNSTVVPTPFLGSAAVAAATPASQSTSPGAAGTSSNVASPSVSASSSLATSPSSSPSVSLSVSTATSTVTSTSVVTVTEFASSTTSSSSPAAFSTDTITSTLVMTVVVPVAPTPASQSDPVDSGTQTSSSPPSFTSAAFAQKERLAQSEATPSATSFPIAASGQRTCKRSQAPSGSTLQRRAGSFLSVPGVGRHRRMQKRSDIFNILF